MNYSLLGLSLAGLLASAQVFAAPMDVWGAAQCEQNPVGPTASTCDGDWYAVVGADGDLVLDADAGTVVVTGSVLLANGDLLDLNLVGELVDADAGFSGNAKVLVGGSLETVLLYKTQSGWLKFGSDGLGFFVRARAE